MGEIYVTSDTHFGHDREFVWGPRGFKSVDEMNTTIVENWNRLVTDQDDVYLLGDVMLGNADVGIGYLKQLKGKIHIILGNHDTNARIELYKACDNVVEVAYATIIKHGKFRYYLSHYPTMTANLESTFGSNCLINLYGHTHQQTNFYQDIPTCYHIGMDSHGCVPVNINDIVPQILKKINECKEML